jgi:hypothetical protein
MAGASDQLKGLAIEINGVCAVYLIKVMHLARKL